MSTSERTFKLLEGFMSYHEQGYSIPEIANFFGLSTSTVYRNLGKIAKNAGVSRESLLEKPFEADHSGRNFTPVPPVDTALFHEHFASAVSGLEGLSQALARTIEEEETISLILQEEFVQ